MSTEDGVQESGDYNRPRRPNPDTVSYLRSLPLDIQASSDEVSRFLDEKKQPTEYPQSLSAALSAIDEIRNEIASLAGDEYGSQCVEILTRIAAPYSEIAARTLLSGLAGYHVHLATHRYGSHVVQTILQLSVTPTVDEDFASHDEAPQMSVQDELQSLPDLILGVADELAPFASQLRVHVCGSHVLRTLLCVLGGVELMQPPGKQSENPFMESGALRRGKFKSKKKKKKLDSGDNSTHHAGMMHMIYRNKSRLNQSSQDSLSHALQTLTEVLSGNQRLTEGPGELQQMACHPSAGPLLIVLLRVLTYSSCPQKDFQTRIISMDNNRSIGDHRLGISQPEPTFELGSPAHVLAQRVLCLQETEPSSNQKYVGDVIYGLSGEPRGSHVLETLLRISHDDVYSSILQHVGFTSPSALQEYVEHSVSNFVVQTLLSSIRTRQQAETLLKSLERLILSGYVLDPLNKRRGVLWRATEAAAKYRVGQDSLLKAVRLGFAVLAEKDDAVDHHDDNAPKETEEEGKKKKKKRRRKAGSSVSIQYCVARLIGLKPPDREGGRVGIDVAGARTIYHLLRFVPRLCGDVLDGIVGRLSRDELELIAKDGLGGRCIMDGILESPNKKEAIFVKATKDIFTKLSGRWVALACERVGHHTVKKVFWGLEAMDDRAELAAELAQGVNRLSGNAMGRAVMDDCCVRDFTGGEKAWRDAVAKKLQRDAWLLDIDGHDKHKPSSGKPSSSKKKRKRKRHKSSVDAEETKNSNDEKEKVGSKQQNTSVVASILNVMSVPTTRVIDNE